MFAGDFSTYPESLINPLFILMKISKALIATEITSIVSRPVSSIVYSNAIDIGT